MPVQAAVSIALGTTGGWAAGIAMFVAGAIDAYLLGQILAPDTPSNISEQNLVIKSAKEAHKVVYGRTSVGGTLLYMDVLDGYSLAPTHTCLGTTPSYGFSEVRQPGRDLCLGIAIAAHEIDAIEQIYIGEDLVYEQDAVGNLVVTNEDYYGKVDISNEFGTQTVSNDFMVAAVSKHYTGGAATGAINAAYYAPNGIINSSFGYNPTAVVSGNSPFSLYHRDCGPEEDTWDSSTNYAYPYAVSYPTSLSSYTGAGEPTEGPAWGPDHIVKNTSYLFIRFKYDKELYTSGIPNVKTVLRGKKVYDPRYDPAYITGTLVEKGIWTEDVFYSVNDVVTVNSLRFLCKEAHTSSSLASYNLSASEDFIINGYWIKEQDPLDKNTWHWSDNWALCLRDYLTSGNYYSRKIANSTEEANVLYGIGVKDSEIDDANIIAAANEADILVLLKNTAETVVAQSYADGIKTIEIAGNHTDYFAPFEKLIFDGNVLELPQYSNIAIRPAPDSEGGLNQWWTYSFSKYLIKSSTYDANTLRTIITFRMYVDTSITDVNIHSNKFTINGVVDTSESPLNILEDMLAAGAGSLPYAQGKYLLLPGIYANEITYAIDDSNLAGAVNISASLGSANLINTVTGTIKNPAANWEETDFYRQTSQDYIDEDGYELVQNVKYPFTTSAFDAQRLARISLQRARFGVSATLVCNLSVLHVPVGAVIQVSIEKLGWVNEVFSVTSWTFQDNTITLGIRQESPLPYVWDNTLLTPIKYEPTSNFSVLPRLLPVTNLAITSGNSTLYIKADGSVATRALLTWDNDTPDFGTYLLVQLTVYKSDGSLPYDTRQIKIDDIDAGKIYITDVEAGDILNVWVSTRLDDPNIILSSAVQNIDGYTVLGKSNAPDSASALTATSVLGGGGVSLSWVNPTDLDFGYIQIKRSNTQLYSSANTVGTSLGTSYTDSVGEGTYYYWIVAKDTTGNSSIEFPANNLGVTGISLAGSVSWAGVYGIPANQILNNLIDPSVWVVGGTGSQGAFSQNGSGDENSIILDVGPHGTTELIWQGKSNGVTVGDPATTTGDGGWNVNFTEGYDHTKTYRFSCWMKKELPLNGSSYLGCDNSGETSYFVAAGGGAAPNPYFWQGMLPSANKWYLVVGLLHGSGYLGGDIGISGVYDPDTGTKVLDGNEYRSTAGATTQEQRAYYYYANLIDAKQWFAKPRVDLVDGNEPSLIAMLNSADVTANSDFVKTIYPADQTALQTQIDGKVESWFQDADPSLTWEGTDAQHEGDMWWQLTNKKLQRWSGTAWSANIEDQKAIDAFSNAAQAQSTADGKAVVFTSPLYDQGPPPPYDLGDLWDAGGTPRVLKACILARASGVYTASDWVVAANEITATSQIPTEDAGWSLTSTWSGVSGSDKPDTYIVSAYRYLDTNHLHPGGLYNEAGTNITGAFGTNPRSYVLSVYDRLTQTWDSHTSYDLHSATVGDAESLALSNALAGLTNSKIIVLVGSHAPAARRTNYDISNQIYRCGGTRSIWVNQNWDSQPSYILVGYPGAGEGSGLEAFADATVGFVETQFTIQNGNILGLISTPVNVDPNADVTNYADNRVSNTSITLNADGTLNGAGGGQATLEGIGGQSLTLLSSGVKPVSITGNNILVAGTVAGWDTQVYSQDGYQGACAMAFKAPVTLDSYFVGLNRDPLAGNGYSGIDFCFYINGGTFQIRAYGGEVFPNTAYAAGTIFSIVYDGVKVKWLVNGVTVHTLSNINDNAVTFYIDVAVYSINTGINNMQFYPLSSSNWNDLGGTGLPDPNATQNQSDLITNNAINGARNNLLSIEEWVEGRTVFDDDFGVYGVVGAHQSNTIVSTEGPFGTTVLAWKGECLTTYSSWCGGFRHTMTATENKFDPTKTYRFSCWVKMSDVTRPFYMGHGESQVSYIQNGIGAAVQTNPYSFNNNRPPSANKWFLMISIIHGTNAATIVKSPMSGWWDPATGKMEKAASDECRFLAATSEHIIRMAIHNRIPGDTVEYYAPRWEAMDGSEPSIVSLLNSADVTNYSDYRVSNSSDDGGVLTIARPVGGAFDGGDNMTGAIIIKLPQSWNNTMMKMAVDVYLYNQSKSFTALVGGYNYPVGSQWVNEFAQILGSTSNDNRVRFSHDGTTCAIIIGNTTADINGTTVLAASVWRYPKVVVKDFQAGYSGATLANWETGWSVTISNSLAGYATPTGDFSDALLDSKRTVYVGNTPAAIVEANASSAIAAAANMSSDGIFSVQEKAAWRIKWPGMLANYNAIIDQSVALEIPGEAVFGAFLTARTDLYNYLHGATHNINAAVPTNSTITGDLLQVYTSAFYDKMQLAVNRLTTVSNSKLVNGVLTIKRPIGAEANYAISSVVGCIKIVLPVHFSNTMMRFNVDVFNYRADSAGASFSLAVGGYNSSGSAKWVNTFADISGSLVADNRVRFGYIPTPEGDRDCILIGNTTADINGTTVLAASTWYYPKISVRDFQGGHSNATVGIWEAGWNIEIDNELNSYVQSANQDYSDALLDANSIINQGDLAVLSKVDTPEITDGAVSSYNSTTVVQNPAVGNGSYGGIHMTLPFPGHIGANTQVSYSVIINAPSAGAITIRSDDFYTGLYTRTYPLVAGNNHISHMFPYVTTNPVTGNLYLLSSATIGGCTLTVGTYTVMEIKR